MRWMILFLLIMTIMHPAVLADELIKVPEPPEKLESAIAVSTTTTQPIQRLSDIKKIFVTPLGTGDGSELIRQKIINQLIQSEIVSVVDSSDAADATLTGAACVSSGMNFNITNGTGGGGTYQTVSLVVRLVSKTKQVLWTWDAAQHRKRLPPAAVAGAMICPIAVLFYPRHRFSVSSEVVKDLTKAIQIDKEANQLSCAH